MKISIKATILILLSFGQLEAQILESEVNPDGIVFPRINELQKNLIVDPVQGQCIYNTTINAIDCYDGNTWSIDESGAFSLFLTSDIILQNATGLIIPDWVEDYDDSDAFNLNDTAFIAPADGIYAFSVIIRWKRDQTDLDNIRVLLRLLGNTAGSRAYLDRISVDSSFGQDSVFSTQMRLQAGNKVQLEITAITGGATIKCGFDTRFMGSRIR